MMAWIKFEILQTGLSKILKYITKQKNIWFNTQIMILTYCLEIECLLHIISMFISLIRYVLILKNILN